ncbi:unnamed protein product [Amoebophrya sp. A25]|nr:unnamed protein product [Amoebophrya sp. A25]|eukprot:GSA25T00012059001.1
MLRVSLVGAVAALQLPCVWCSDPDSNAARAAVGLMLEGVHDFLAKANDAIVEDRKKEAPRKNAVDEAKKNLADKSAVAIQKNQQTASAKMTSEKSQSKADSSSRGPTREEALDYLEEIGHNLGLLAELLTEQDTVVAQKMEEQTAQSNELIAVIKEDTAKTKEAADRKSGRLSKAMRRRSQQLSNALSGERSAEQKLATSERMRGTLRFRLQQLLDEQKMLRDRMKQMQSRDYVTENGNLRSQLDHALVENTRLSASARGLLKTQAQLLSQKEAAANNDKCKRKVEELFTRNNELQLRVDAHSIEKEQCEKNLDQQLSQSKRMLDQLVADKGFGSTNVHSKNASAWESEVRNYVQLQPREALDDIVARKVLAETDEDTQQDKKPVEGAADRSDTGVELARNGEDTAEQLADATAKRLHDAVYQNYMKKILKMSPNNDFNRDKASRTRSSSSTEAQNLDAPSSSTSTSDGSTHTRTLKMTVRKEHKKHRNHGSHGPRSTHDKHDRQHRARDARKHEAATHHGEDVELKPPMQEDYALASKWLR